MKPILSFLAKSIAMPMYYESSCVLVEKSFIYCKHEAMKNLCSILEDKNNYDQNFNVFNVDMIYNWEFAPGSHFSIAWKNNINQDDDLGRDNYYSNVHKTFTAPQSNGLSAKLIYYLDYQYLKMKRA